MLLLKIAFVVAALVYLGMFMVKEIKNPHLYASIALFAIYEVLFIIYHPLVGILTTVFLGILLLLCYNEVFTDKIKRVNLVGIYFSGFFACIGILYQAVETFAGRLF